MPKAEMDAFLDQLLSIAANWEVRDIVMHKEIIAALLKQKCQTEREAKDIQGIFVDMAVELTK